MRLRTISRLVIGGVIVVVVAIAAIAATAPRSQPSAGVPTWEGAGTTSLQNLPAPTFALRDQNGALTSVRGQRGHYVILTFFYTHCLDTCPLTAQKLRMTLRALGPEASKVRVLIISTDPLHDNPADARAFLRRNGLPTWHFLLGSYGQLTKIWKEYGIYVPSATMARRNGPAHSAYIYLINKTGREQVLLDDTIPAAALAQNLHILLRDHRWIESFPVAPVVNDRAPDFGLPSMRGGRIDLRRFRGKPLLVNFWATWCPSCRSEMPLLERTYRRYKGRVQIVGIDEQEPLSEVKAYVHHVHVTYPIVLDSNGDSFYSYQLAGTPTTFFLDGQGVIKDRQLGRLSQKIMTHDVASLLKS